jgi:protein-S-isoprenylcysteine O-methyltransferase Ste14
MPQPAKSGSKRIVWTILAALLNAELLLLPSILLGHPSLILEDRRLAVFIMSVTVWIILESFASQRPIAQQEPKTSGGCLANLMSAAILALFLVSLTEQALTGIKPFTLSSVLGLILMALGIGLRFLAIRALAAYFFDALIIVSGQPLITNGVYAYIRHPSELGNLCIAFACSIILGSIGGLLFSSVLILPIVLIRIYLEDTSLRQHFPAQFSAYSRDVPALLPWRLPQKPS